MRALSYVLSCLATLCLPSLANAELPAGVVNTQPQGDVPLTPQESLAKISVPDGFRVTLFAGEPDVYQPIAMEFDDRGRLWVVENFSYPDWKSKDRDRILIFEDQDNDGQFDKRIVFADNLSNITGIALGYGGVWCCSTPNLVFIPDSNRDDKPDGPPVIKLDGWNDESDDIEHNVFNGMTWGPDGWMYGSHGILADSFVGKPGSRDANRTRLNCGIWRYHPVSEQFEVVAHGTTNPWGIDFNEVGEGFFTNCVIGHLWHLIPGAHYKRMYGKHFNPYTYIEIDACSDHLHWGGGHWTDSRGGQGIHSVAGGGHAHVGSMVYLGGKWPAEFHGSMFTCNLHGNRINRDPIRRSGSGYVATHGPDFLMANDPWFRGLAIKYGPDGNVFVSDWTDLGECHDKDGTHRSSGRIYKISFGDASTERQVDLATLPSNELLEILLQQPNAWQRRHALRILQERRQSTGDLPKFDIQDAVRSAIEVAADTTRPKLERLRALWFAGGDADGLEHLARDADPHVQAWYIRLRGTSVLLSNPAVSNKPRKELVELIRLARDKSTALNVKLEIASTLRNGFLNTRYLGEAAWDMAEALIDGLPAQADPNLTPMVWYAIEKMHQLSPRRFVKLAIPKKGESINEARLQILELIVRKSMSYDRRQSTNLQYLVEAASVADNTSIRLAMLRGIDRALQGTKQVSMPNGWEALYRAVQTPVAVSSQHSGDEKNEVVTLQRIADKLAVKFRHAEVIIQLRKRATDVSQPIVDRERAVRQLVSHLGVDGCGLSLSTLGANEPRLLPEVYRQLGSSNAAEAEKYLKQSVKSLSGLLLQRGTRPPTRLSKDIRSALVGALVAKSERVNWLLDAIESKEVSSKAILPVDAMQIERLEDKQVNVRLRRLWGVARKSSKEKRKQIATWKGVLTDAYVAKADLANGRRLFHENCGKCHRLFGVGNEIGPDLTGSGRRNLDYVLQNVIDPSSAVGRDYRLTSLILESGLVATGVVVAETPSSITLQKVDGKETIARSEIEETNSTRLSLMPEGQFDRMRQSEVRDLIGFLRQNADLAE